MLEKIPEYLVPIYALVIEKDSTARKLFLAETIGRIYELKSTQEFLQEQKLKGIEVESLEKKSSESSVVKKNIDNIVNYFSNVRFKNIAAKLLHDNPDSFDILSGYIENLKFENLTDKQIDNRIDVIKNLNSISKLLKADPYNEPSFTKAVLSKVTDWGFDGIKSSKGMNEEITLLRKSLNYSVNKGLIKDFIGNNIYKQKNAKEIIELIVSSEKTKEIECTILTSMAAFSAVGMASLKLANPDSMKDLLNGVKSGLSFLPEVASSAVNAIQTSPWGHVLLAGIAIVVASKTIGDSHKKIVKYIEEKQIRYVDVKNNDYDSTTSLLTNNIMSGLILKSFYDLNDDASKKYLILCSFLIEKTKNPKFTVTDNLEQDLGISKIQAKKLNELTREDIHELYFVNTPEIKQYLLLNNVDEKEKNILKKISLIQEVTGIDNNYDGKLFKSISTINGLTQELKDKINYLDDNKKKIVESYLNLHRNKENNVSPRKLDFFAKNLSNNDVCEMINLEVLKFQEQTIVKNKEADKENFLVSYFKRMQKMPSSLWDHYVARTGEKEKVSTVNADVKDEIERVSQKYGLIETQKLNEFYPSIVSKARKLKIEVFNKIDSIRTLANQSSHNALHSLIDKIS